MVRSTSSTALAGVYSLCIRHCATDSAHGVDDTTLQAYRYAFAVLVTHPSSVSSLAPSVA